MGELQNTTIGVKTCPSFVSLLFRVNSPKFFLNLKFFLKKGLGLVLKEAQDLVFFFPLLGFRIWCCLSQPGSLLNDLTQRRERERERELRGKGCCHPFWLNTDIWKVTLSLSLLSPLSPSFSGICKVRKFDESSSFSGIRKVMKFDESPSFSGIRKVRKFD
jgi:polyferredoxin